MEHHLAKVGAAGSNPVSRFDIEKISKKLLTNENSYDTISELLFERFKKATKNNLKKLLTNMKHFDII